MEAATNTLLVVDWSQTRNIARNPDKWREGQNWFLKANPTTEEVDMYYAGSVALNSALHKYLPAKWLNYYQIGFIGLETGMIVRNYKLGIKPKP
jgi:hypothetical protein